MAELMLERFLDRLIANDHSGSPTLIPEQPVSSTSGDYSSQNPSGGSPRLQLVPPETEAAMKPQVKNVISSVDLGCILDLDFIACNAWNVEYRPRSFKGLIMRIRKPRSTATMYSSGNIVCSGSTSAELSRLAARRFARIVQKLGFPVRFLNFKVRNMMACCDTFPVRMESMAQHEHCSYEQELFPALFYCGVPGVSVRVAPSGKIAILGPKTEAEVLRAFDIIYPILRRFRRS